MTTALPTYPLSPIELNMDHPIDNELRQLCQTIVEEDHSQEEWAEIESDDMFRLGEYVGGFDATEMAFCFSVHLEAGEHWLQLSLEEVRDVLVGRVTSIDIQPAARNEGRNGAMF